MIVYFFRIEVVRTLTHEIFYEPKIKFMKANNEMHFPYCVNW